jgi:hypothetical protein
MKRLILLALLVAVCGGCRSTYVITLNNGSQITAKGKPKYDSDKGTLFYTDAVGQKQQLSITRVRNYQPQGWKGSQFID